MRQQVYYSVAFQKNDRCERQWTQSIRSLRRYNRQIEVALLVYNTPPPSLLKEADTQNVSIHLLGQYSECFRDLPLQWQHALIRYPALHKFLSFTKVDFADVSQLLYLDCDTFFFQDVSQMFSRYSECHWYAREEPHSSRSPYGYNQAYIDEDLLSRIARQEGLTSIPPYNTGVCMLNHHAWLILSSLHREFLTYAWRVHQGLQERLALPNLPRRVAEPTGVRKEIDAIPFPSSNSWILGQISVWLTMGKIPGLSHDVLRYTEIVQGREFEDHAILGEDVIMAHYYSNQERRFFEVVPPLHA